MPSVSISVVNFLWENSISTQKLIEQYNLIKMIQRRDDDVRSMRWTKTKLFAMKIDSLFSVFFSKQKIKIKNKKKLIKFN